MSRKVSLVVLAWNRWDLTERCLDTLAATDLEGAEVWVVDNGSTDETPARLAERSGIHVLRLDRNLGFVRGNNAALEAVDPDSDVLLLNNDLVFEQADWLQRLRAAAHSAPEIGVVGCRLTLPDGRLLHAGTYILPDTMWGQQIGALETDVGQYGALRDVEGIVFACAYLKREAIDRLGGLALDFESYFEDTDYCLRAREAGFRVVCCGEVTLVHDEHGSTQSQPESLHGLFRESQKIFDRKWRRKLEAGYGSQVVWHSILNFPSGYARACRALLRGLDERGLRMVYRYAYGAGSPFGVEETGNTGDYYLNVLRDREPGARPELSVVFGQGDVFFRARGRRRIGYTMLEVDRFPEEWVRQANAMDEVWVPSEFNREGMLASGVTRPVHVMPLGVDPDYFSPAIRGVRNPDGDFVFLSSFEWGERKCPWQLLETFNRTFRSREPVRLVVKILNRDPRVSVTEEIRKLGLSEAGGRISYLLNLELPNQQLGVLYRSADCYVAPSRGEGWNMPLCEAMACDLPAIATDWGAHTEFFDESVGYPLRTLGTAPARAANPYYQGARWADPDFAHLAELLRHVYENREEAALRGRAAGDAMRRRWSWSASSARIAERLAGAAGAPRHAGAGEERAS
ncbi:MAG: glycosyltransferase [Acidobacteria bacterium]|nr:glycosyltransferase [Acidobacteriota bacterium]